MMQIHWPGFIGIPVVCQMSSGDMSVPACVRACDHQAESLGVAQSLTSMAQPSTPVMSWIATPPEPSAWRVVTVPEFA